MREQKNSEKKALTGRSMRKIMKKKRGKCSLFPLIS
jgi:hypothetical protein